MNSEVLTSWLIRADWFFLVTWIALLAAAVGIGFREHSGSATDGRSRSEPNPPWN